MILPSFFNYIFWNVEIHEFIFKFLKISKYNTIVKNIKEMSNEEIPSKEEIIRNMAKHLQTHPEDGEEVLERTYDLAFIKGKLDSKSK